VKPPKLPIVYAFPCRWDMTPARQRYLMQAISQHVPVYFLNWPTLNGRLLDAPRPRAEAIAPNLTVIHNAFGFRCARLGRHAKRLASMVDAAWLHRLLGQHGVTEYVYWLSAVMPDLLWGMRTDRLVYDCIDPSFDENDSEFDQREFSIARQAKLAFCTADALLERIRPVQPRAHLLPNACSIDEYHAAELEGLARPAALRDRTGPVIGYMGTFDARVDTELLTQAATALPQYTFAMVGRINPGQEDRVRPLQALPNVVMPGSVSVEEGRAYTAAFDIGLIPFLPGPTSDAINPVKMWMYLAAGKPVVSTDIRECKKLAPHVISGTGAPGFIDAIRAALTPDNAGRSAERIAVAMQNTWAHRASDAIEILDRAGLLTPTAAADAPGTSRVTELKGVAA
jgi:glycosyltransferase involved in cell wall biosynthesis